MMATGSAGMDFVRVLTREPGHVPSFGGLYPSDIMNGMMTPRSRSNFKRIISHV